MARGQNSKRCISSTKVALQPSWAVLSDIFYFLVVAAKTMVKLYQTKHNPAGTPNEVRHFQY